MSDYGKTKIGNSSEFPDPKPKRGWSRWIEEGVWFTAPKVSSRDFGAHAYGKGGYGRGITDCPCGCFMLSSSSGGPVDPFGPCPRNPKSKRQPAKKDSKLNAAITLLKQHGYTVRLPPPETEYAKALRTGVKPDIWPPISMTREELDHFRRTHGIT